MVFKKKNKSLQYSLSHGLNFFPPEKQSKYKNSDN